MTDMDADEKKSMVEALKKVKARISTPEKWTKGVEARAASGVQVDPSDILPSAGPDERQPVCWCITGSFHAEAVHASLLYISGLVESNDASYRILSARAYARHVLSKLEMPVDAGQAVTLANFNDAETTTHADVMALFDLAIETLDNPGGRGELV